MRRVVEVWANQVAIFEHVDLLDFVPKVGFEDDATACGKPLDNHLIVADVRELEGPAVVEAL